MDKEQFYKEFFRYLECGSCADLEFCQKQLEPACKTGLAIYRKLKMEDLEKENEQLKCQLAEKEREKEDWIRAFEELAIDSIDHESYNATVDEYEKEIEELKIYQNQTAIAELEKVRNCFGDYLKGLLWNDTMLVGKVCNMINEIFDQQIKSLKGESE